MSDQVGKNNIWGEARMAAAVACSPFRLVAADFQSAEWTLVQLGELATENPSPCYGDPILTHDEPNPHP